jgi:hypothetical protein
VNANFECIELTSIAIVFTYQAPWQQDDVDVLIDHFFNQYALLDKKDHSQGADIESVRFTWNNNDFTLFFECYSDSIWIDSTECNSPELLSLLFQVLNK